MLRFFKYLSLAATLALGCQSGWGFALLGPVNEGWQDPIIGYDWTGRDIGAPKNIGEEYRWNTPVAYYAFDANFLDYFGSNGVAAVEQAVAILNDLTNTPFSRMDLNAFPLESFRVNPRAEALQLLDLKSSTLHFICEELGLTEPARYTWTLHSRKTQPGLSCPFMEYTVVMRNFDPFTWQPCPYVNGVLYTYLIKEFCTGPNPLAYTEIFPVDPMAQTAGAVMSLGNLLVSGRYTMGLTRDDVGGLRYLMCTNNVNWEKVSTDSEWIKVNTTQSQLLAGSNLTLFAAQALTNDATALTALYPGLVVASSTNTWLNTWVPNITAYFTNSPWDPVGTFPHLAFATNYTLNISPIYTHTFANLMIMRYSGSSWTAVPMSTIPRSFSPVPVMLMSISATNSPWLPIGSVVPTNVWTATYMSNWVTGEFFIMPTNACNVAILGLQATTTNWYTNVLTSATNSFTVSNTNGVAATNNQFFEMDMINGAVQHFWLYYPIDCLATNTTTLREGMDSIRFVRTSFDSLLGRFYQPITNYYSLIEITNSRPVVNNFRRVVTRPDFLFTCDDQGTSILSRSGTPGNFYTNNENIALAGPGTVEPNMRISFNKVGPLLNNFYFDPTVMVDSGLSQATTLGTNFMWGSFDGTTNDPIVYPDGTSIMALENEIIFRIVTPDLPAGQVGAPYFAELDSVGGQEPIMWSPVVGSSPLPPGLVLAASGMITGTPTAAGVFPFTVMVSEGGARIAIRPFTITISP
jgi:hypothetical protein